MKILNKLKYKFRTLLIPRNQLLSEIKPEIEILDIGCGSGSILKLIIEAKNPNLVGGLEISKELVDQCKENLQTIYPSNKTHIELFDGFKIPNFCKLYSQVIVIDVLHHIPDDKKKLFLSNLHQVLSPGSIVIFKDIDSNNKLLLIFNKLHDLISSGSFGFEINVDKTLQLLKETKFTVIKNYSAPKLVYAHHFFICST